MYQNKSIMLAQQDIKINFSTLEEKIQKLIYLCEELKKENKRLIAEKRQLTILLDEEKERIGRLDEGYKNLKEIEKTSTKQSITTMKRKINDIILEIDRNMSLIDDKS